ncbi:sugar kinase [Elioraea sp.]|jgi:2-dehydro-3-deoxygluconokinase|uniref:sugar kinase n=1 Tax=Elioraea sp. TaxID=2185103 RepID=UPI0021DF3845|nr:sugar kinase [Elioraea sp.]GIX09927.1 MAG: fructokinase-like protein [Elioraea sp.]
MSVDLLCMGEPMLEFNRQPDDGTGRALYLRGFGGDTSNAAIAAARQGVRAGYITAIGTDWAGDAFLRLWAEEGVDTATVIRDPEAPTGVYFVDHDARGHHFTFYRSGSAASRYTPAMLPEAAIRGARIFYASGISQGISASAADAVFRAIEIARAAGVTVAYDTNLRLRLWPAARARAVIHEAIAMSDIALPSRDDAEALTGLADPQAIAERYLRLGPRMVAVKCGRDGALLATADGRMARAAPHAVEAVDATGAGDTFCGSFLARIILGDAPEAALRYANAAAALSTTGYGAVAPIPRRAAVEALLAR